MSVVLEEVVALTLQRRGYEWESRPFGKSAEPVVGLVRRRGGRHPVPLVVTKKDLAKAKSRRARVDLLEKRIRNAERTIENLEWLEARQIHELELVNQGWTPPAGWRNPFKENLLGAKP